MSIIFGLAFALYLNMKKTSAASLKLKQFIEDNIPFAELKQVGFFAKGVRKADYQKIAERICEFFGYKSIYEYKPPCSGVKCDGNCDEPCKPCKSYIDIIHGHEPLILDRAAMVSQDIYLN